ncbi:ABC transporter family substrate-binding protein [Georgenia sp. SYP-B2076]|uniref:ABC transporter family substrate-binding protein n=1 Tax=Georgenia sp. SYP-B2076 TaxID=2495881 RepID=UPI0013E063C6|nr:ABC transporter family substrate-binding protein [Georgenia sp. SYP-B2076]
MRRTKGLAALATGVALALAGCTTSNVGGADPTASAGVVEPGGGIATGEGELFEVNATPRAELDQGGTLRRAVGPLPEQWNPLHVGGANAAYSDVFAPISVANWDFDGAGVPTPNENFLLGFDDDMVGEQEVVVLHLNPDAVWNSGKPITWQDYAATVSACNGSNAEFQCATGAFAAVQSVEQGDTPFDVVVTFSAAFPDWKAALSTVLPADGVADPATFNEGWLEHPADWATGPFAVESTDAAQQVLTLVPNERWWGPAPILDEIQYRVVSPEGTALAFQNGELDVFDVGADPNAFQIASAVPGADVRRAGSTSWRNITFNSSAGALTELAVRQAIVRSLDRSVIAASSLAGLPAELQRPLDNHIFLEGQEGYEDNAADYGYDPVGARAALDAAGWTPDPRTGIRERDGEPLVVRFSVLTGVPVSENEGQLVQAQLREVGIDVELDQVPEAKFGETLFSGDFELMGMYWYGSPYPMVGLGEIYGDPATAHSNFARVASPELDEVIAKIATETDHEARLELADQADELIWAEAHTLPLYQRPQLVAAVSDLANVGATGLSSTRPENWGFVAG